MGVIVFVNFFFNELEEKIKNYIFKFILEKFQVDNMFFKGVLFVEIVIIEEKGVLELYLLDFSVCFKDIECQMILFFLESLFLDLCLVIVKGELYFFELVFFKEFVMSVVFVFRNYFISFLFK